MRRVGAYIIEEKMPDRDSPRNPLRPAPTSRPDGPNLREYYLLAIKAARAEVTRVERLIDVVRSEGGFNPEYGSVTYIVTNSLAPAKARLIEYEWRLFHIRRDARRAQLRKGRQAYELRHPERASRFLTLRNKTEEQP